MRKHVGAGHSKVSGIRIGTVMAESAVMMLMTSNARDTIKMNAAVYLDLGDRVYILHIWA